MQGKRSFVACSLAVLLSVHATGCTYAIQIPTKTEKEAVAARCDEQAQERNYCGTRKGDKALEAYFDTEQGKKSMKGYGFGHPDYRSAEAFCKNIVIFGQKASNHYAIGGWSMSVAGAIGTGALTGLATKEDSKSGVALTGAGAALSAAVTIAGVYLLTRSSAASRASSEAATGLQEAKPEDSWKKCIEARLHWQESNAKATDNAAAAFKDLSKGDGKKDGEKKDGEKKDDQVQPAGAGTGTPVVPSAGGTTPPSAGRLIRTIRTLPRSFLRQIVPNLQCGAL